MWRESPPRKIFGAVCVAFSCSLAHALDAIGNAPAPENKALPPNLQPSIASSIPALAQFKKGLLDLGYNLQWNYAAEVFGNPTGGVKQGSIYAGPFEMSVDGDCDRIAGLSGATFHKRLSDHGRGLSTFNL